MEEPEMFKMTVVLVVPKEHVKTVKTALERCDKRDRGIPISPAVDKITQTKILDEKDYMRRDELASSSLEKAKCMRIPTTIPFEPSDKDLHGQTTENLKAKIIQELDLQKLEQHIQVSAFTLPIIKPEPRLKNPLQKALQEALDTLPSSVLADLNLTTDQLTFSFPESYSIYSPLLLLPNHAFNSDPWRTFLGTYPFSSITCKSIFTHISTCMKTTHIALNSPIPLNTSSAAESFEEETPNTLRQPLHLTPIYGSFPPTPTSPSSPTPQDFSTALWISTTQNGIQQIWAPQHTMFSRGNISEKTRLLQHPNINSKASSGSAVVDMYAGIGYFAFSYRAAGCRPVVCFEINEWSVEGMRRGAERNGWNCHIYQYPPSSSSPQSNEMEEETVEVDWSADFIIFRTSNANADRILSRAIAGKKIPPIRHVNLGLLPLSRGSWKAAVGCLADEGEGWVHAHENVGVSEMESRTVEVEGEFQRLVDERVGVGRRRARVEHVEGVKMYAPGVMHCVFDVCVGKRGRNAVEE